MAAQGSSRSSLWRPWSEAGWAHEPHGGSLSCGYHTLSHLDSPYCVLFEATSWGGMALMLVPWRRARADSKYPSWETGR